MEPAAGFGEHGKEVHKEGLHMAYPPPWAEITTCSAVEPGLFSYSTLDSRNLGAKIVRLHDTVHVRRDKCNAVGGRGNGRLGGKRP